MNKKGKRLEIVLLSVVCTLTMGVENIYRPVKGDMTNETANGNKVDVENWYYEYIPTSDPHKIKTVFDEFVRKIISIGENARADISLNEHFSVYQMKGEPLFDTNVGSVSYNGGSIVWDHEGAGVPLTGLYYLSFYVKADQKNMVNGLYYSPLESAFYTVTGPFKTAANPHPDPLTGEYPISTISKDWEKNYVDPDGHIKSDTPPNLSDYEVDVTQLSATGADQHQQNRKDGETTRNFTSGSLLELKPEITSLESGIGLKGRTKVILKLNNGSHMKFQWQVKNDNGEWEDIFGATASQYTLGSQFKAGREYELRCKITNGAGSIFYSDVLKTTATAGTKSEGLQSK